ncbi:hypothetical protein HDU81_004836 [Chytriomyces hyalinus]|nr:hypothetical protein HDU81_004836 [Chytriomyces hyalinus]
MTAQSDSVKLDLKRQLKIQSQCLEEYALNDVPEYPGWTFMLSDVTQAYGTCPFLNICDEARNQRVAWLESQADQGVTYHAAVRAVLDDFQELQQSISEQRNAIVVFVAAHIPVETVDRICQAFHAKKVSKCQSKHSRHQWNCTVEELDALATETGIDMAHYVQVVTGYAVRYKPAAAENEAFVNIYVQFQKLNTLLHSKTVQQAAVKDVAKSAFVTLIQHNFMIQQTGRYYKKWSSLTSEKKMDRVRSYCSWFVRSKCLPMHIVDGIVEFVSTQMANKSIRSSDIQ